MNFSQENEVFSCCIKGMEEEGKGSPAEALKWFQQAWDKAGSDFEKFTAAHYLARQQPDVSAKLEWDQLALQHALQVEDEQVKGALPSLYLNIGKCYEDLGDLQRSRFNYEAANSYAHYLPEEGYGKMIRSGIIKGLERVGI
jgi:rifampin ADP-ribosylating transferase